MNTKRRRKEEQVIFYTYNHEIAQLREKVWVSWKVVEDNVPDTLDTVPAVKVESLSVQQELALSIKELTASLCHLVVLLCGEIGDNKK